MHLEIKQLDNEFIFFNFQFYILLFCNILTTNL